MKLSLVFLTALALHAQGLSFPDNTYCAGDCFVVKPLSTASPNVITIAHVSDHSTPFTWMRRHPKLSMFLAATATTTIMVASKHPWTSNPAPGVVKVESKLSTCGECTGVGR